VGEGTFWKEVPEAIDSGLKEGCLVSTLEGVVVGLERLRSREEVRVKGVEVARRGLLGEEWMDREGGEEEGEVASRLPLGAEKNLTFPTPLANFLDFARLTTPRSPSSSSVVELLSSPPPSPPASELQSSPSSLSFEEG